MPAFPITTTAQGICFAFPDICKTPAPPGPPVPVPYPNIGQLTEASDVSDSTGTGKVTVGGSPVVLANTSTIPTTTGDEAGNAPGGVISNGFGQKVEFPQGSSTVTIHGKAVVRMLDPTKQNDGNADGVVLGGVPNVLVGG
jgi:hypothetical protein